MLALGYLAISGLMIGTAALLDAFPDHVPVDIGFHVLPKLTGQMLAFPIEDYLIYWHNGKLPKSAKSLDGISRVMTPCPIRGMVFDMDGVIIDSHPTHRRAWKQFLQSVGRGTTDVELDFILDGRKREEILRHFLGDLSVEQIREYGERKDDMLRRLGNGTHPVEGVVELLASLKRAGLRAGLATSAGGARTRGTLSELGLGSYFDAIITGDEVATGKPNPLIYRLAAERMQEEPQYLIAVEDAVAGVKAATDAGMRCVGVASAQRADELRSAGANPVVPHFGSFSLSQLQACFR